MTQFSPSEVDGVRRMLGEYRRYGIRKKVSHPLKVTEGPDGQIFGLEGSPVGGEEVGSLDVATLNTSPPLVPVPDSGPSSETGVTELWFDRQSGVRFQPNVSDGLGGLFDVVTLLPAGNAQQGVVTVTEPNDLSGGGFYGLVAQQLGRGNKDVYGFVATGCTHIRYPGAGSSAGSLAYHVVLVQGDTANNSRGTNDYGSIRTYSSLPSAGAKPDYRRLQMTVPGPYISGHSSGSVFGPDLGWTFEQAAASGASSSNPLGDDNGYGQFTIGNSFGPWSPGGQNVRPWGSLLPPPPPFGGARVDQPARVAYAVSYPAVGSRPGGIDHGRTYAVGLAYGVNQAVSLYWSGGLFTAAYVSATAVSPPPPVPPVVSPPVVSPPIFPPPPPPPPPPTIVTIIGTKGKKGGTPGFDGPPVAGGPEAGTSPPPSTPSGSPNMASGSPVPPLAPPGVTSPGVPAFVTDARSRDILILQDDDGDWRRVRIDGTGTLYASPPITFP